MSLDAITVGDHLTIDDGANAEQVTVTSVGSGGLTGSGVSFTPALRKDHNGDVVVHDEGTGITFVPAVKSAYPASVPATSTGTGITLSAALSRPHGVGVEARDLGSGIVLTQPLSASVAEGEALTSNMNAYYPQARWTAAIQNDFAARADWQTQAVYANQPRARRFRGGEDAHGCSWTERCVERHQPPIRTRIGSPTSGGNIERRARSPGAVVLSGADTANATFTVPGNARPGQTIHFILEVQDSGTPPLTRYQRVVVTVR